MSRVHIYSMMGALMLAVMSFTAVHVYSLPAAEAATHATCSDCHKRGKTLKAPTVNALCLSCHPDNTKDHVLGVIPVNSPQSLPLDKEKKLDCITCHEPHGKNTVNQLLRMNKAELCIACHAPK